MASKKPNGETYGKGRSRNFATVVYPESAPDKWELILSEYHIQAFISPLHDKDYNVDGELKKAHYHVMVMYESQKTDDQVREVFDSIGGVGLEKISTLRGYARYLCHLDNPEKYQYNIEQVKSLSGAVYSETIGLPSDKYKVVSEMIEFCQNERLYSYSDLLDYSRIHRPDWFRALCDNSTRVMTEYLKSKYWTDNNQQSY